MSRLTWCRSESKVCLEESTAAEIPMRDGEIYAYFARREKATKKPIATINSKYLPLL